MYKFYSTTFFSILESRIDIHNYLDLTELYEFEGKLLLNQNECQVLFIGKVYQMENADQEKWKGF